MGKKTNCFDLDNYYDGNYDDEFEDVNDLDDDYDESDNYDDYDDDERDEVENDEDTFGEDSYSSYESVTSEKKQSTETRVKVPIKGAEVHKQFFKIMEDYHSGDTKKMQYANECAIKALEGFVFHIIKKSYSTYVRDNFYDMVQEGNLGIMVGMEKYDPNKSMPTTFFSPYIKHEIQKHITRQVDKTTAHYSTSIKKINKAIEAFDAENIQYTNVDIAIQTGLSLETVNQSMAIRNYRDEVHIDACVPGMIDNNQISSKIATPEEEYLEKEEKNILYTAIMNNLTPQEIKVLELHFGINNVETISEGEISKCLGIPKDKVKKLINSSIRKLKNSELKDMYRNHLANEDKLIQETEISLVPNLTIDTQLNILSSLTSDEE